jgi:lipoprotein signal peptidase
MPFRRLYTILALIICLLIYLRIRNRKNTLGYIIITTIIASAIYNLIIPSDMSIVDMFDNNYLKRMTSAKQKHPPKAALPCRESF